MKKLAYLASISLLTISLVSCKKDPIDKEKPTGGSNYILTGEIKEDFTLKSDSAWTLKGYVYVKSGAKITIPAGTLIKSDIIEKGALIIEPGAQIIAEGNATAPIIFTSGQPKGQRRPGDWGGIIVLGNATTNRGTNPKPIIEGGVGIAYGGDNDADNSGVIKYVRIEYAGIAAQPNSEINGLTFGGVGNGTVVEHVMVSYANDDAYEFFGGTVNAKYLIAYAAADDDFDFDYGYRGKIQYGISIKHPQYADPGDAANGIEADNDGDGSNATPNTRPELSNFTFIGPNNASNTQSNHNLANRWRRGVQFVLNNSIMLGHQKGGFSLESASTANSYFEGVSQFNNNIIVAVANNVKSDQPAPHSAVEVLAKTLADGVVYPEDVNVVGLTNPFKWYTDKNTPNVAPISGSMVLSGADFTGMSSWFKTETFRGAIGTSDWTQGWTNWNPNDAQY